jgi:hypothetical protein
VLLLLLFAVAAGASVPCPCLLETGPLIIRFPVLLLLLLLSLVTALLIRNHQCKENHSLYIIYNRRLRALAP